MELLPCRCDPKINALATLISEFEFAIVHRAAIKNQPPDILWKLGEVETDIQELFGNLPEMMGSLVKLERDKIEHEYDEK